jgi:MFS family permease
MLVATVMMTSQVVGPFYLSMPLALDAARVGIAMACGPAAAALGGVPAGRAVDRFGPGRVASAGLAVMVAGCALVAGLAGLPAGLGVAGYVVPMAVLTLGYALFQAANSSAVMAGAGAERRGVVSGMLSLARNLGFMTGAAVMGAVFAWGVGSGDLAHAQPQAVAAGMRTGFAAAAALGGIAFGIQWRAAARVRLSGVNAGRDPGSGTWRAVFLRRRRRPRADTP